MKANLWITPIFDFAGHARQSTNAFDSTPEPVRKSTANGDRVVVDGLWAPRCGIRMPQEMIAGLVSQHADRFRGVGSVDPNDSGCVDKLEHNVTNLGLRGLK